MANKVKYNLGCNSAIISKLKICRIGLGTIRAILTLLKIQKIIKEKYGIKISHNGVWKMLKRLNYTISTLKLINLIKYF